MSNVIQLTVLIFWISMYPCIGAEECSRYSPQEIWYSDYSPWLNQTIEGIQISIRRSFGIVMKCCFAFRDESVLSSGIRQTGRQSLQSDATHRSY